MKIALLTVFLIVFPFAQGCNPPICSYDDTCEFEDEEDEIQAVPVAVARGKVHGDRVASIELALAPPPAGSMPMGSLLFVPALTVPKTAPDWRQQTANASWRWHEPTVDGAKYVFERTYVTVGRWVPTATYCYASSVNGDRMQCRDAQGGPALFVCPAVTVGEPLAYSENRGYPYKYDFSSRFKITTKPTPKATKVVLGNGIKPDGKPGPAIYCQYPLTGKTLTVTRR